MAAPFADLPQFSISTYWHACKLFISFLEAPAMRQRRHAPSPALHTFQWSLVHPVARCK